MQKKPKVLSSAFIRFYLRSTTGLFIKLALRLSWFAWRLPTLIALATKVIIFVWL